MKEEFNLSEKEAEKLKEKALDCFGIKEEFNLKEKIEQLFNQWKTSWKYLENHGLKDAEWHGECVFLNFGEVDFINELDKTHKEFIRLLKEKLDKCEGLGCDKIREIDKLSGDWK